MVALLSAEKALNRPSPSAIHNDAAASGDIVRKCPIISPAKPRRFAISTTKNNDTINEMIRFFSFFQRISSRKSWTLSIAHLKSKMNPLRGAANIQILSIPISIT